MEYEKERNINVWLPLMLPLLGTWPITQACALTQSQRPLGSQASTQSTEPHQPGLFLCIFLKLFGKYVYLNTMVFFCVFLASHKVWSLQIYSDCLCLFNIVFMKFIKVDTIFQFILFMAIKFFFLLTILFGLQDALFPQNLGRKWGCVLQSECRLPGSLRGRGWQWRMVFSPITLL